MKCRIMQDFIKAFNVCKKILRQKYDSYKNYNRTQLDIYNGPSQVYCIKQIGRVHWYSRTKGTVA